MTLSSTLSPQDAQRLFARRLWRNAADAYRTLQPLAPSDRIRFAISLFHSGEKSSAMECLDSEAVAAEANRRLLHAHVVTPALRRGDAATVAEMLARVVAGAPEATGDRALLARALSSLGRREEARAQLSRALEMEPDNLDLVAQLLQELTQDDELRDEAAVLAARHSSRCGENDRFAALCLRALARAEDADAIVTACESLARSGKNPGAQTLAVARLLLKSNRPELALDICEALPPESRNAHVEAIIARATSAKEAGVSADRSSAAPAELDAFRRKFDSGEWEAAIETAPATEKLDSIDVARLACAKIHAGRMSEALSLLTPPVVSNPAVRKTLRLRAVAPAMSRKDYEAAAAVQQVLHEADPDSPAEMITLAGLLGRIGRRSDARALADRAAELEPDNSGIALLQIQLRLQLDDPKGAAEIARLHAEKCASDPRLAHLCLLALARSGDLGGALSVHRALVNQGAASEEATMAVAMALLDAREPRRAADLCIEALRDGKGSGRLHVLAAQGLRDAGAPEEQALVHINAAVAALPEDTKLLRMLGELLLETRQYERAAELFDRLAPLTPDQPLVQMQRVRALRYSRKFAEAADIMVQLAQKQPQSTRLSRFATSALTQAGRTEEARQMFENMLGARREKLPGTFLELLDNLENQVDTSGVPKGRLDFAWELSHRLSSAGPLMDRAKWDRRALWGSLADLAILDWLECKPAQASEVSDIFRYDMKAADPLVRALERGKGALLVSAHVGPMYAGPLVLHQAGIEIKFLASAPSVSSSAYADRLISTSDQTEEQVARQVVDALRKNMAVILAVDGQMSPAAPRTEWQGQQVTYTGFAAALSQRLGAPSFFAAPYWRFTRREIAFAMTAMPSPFPSEPMDAFMTRWRDKFFAEVNIHLLRGPENFRLSGGIWRSIA